MAAACHLPGIAVGILLWPRWRSVRLVRYHATLALGLQGMCLGLLWGGSLVASLLGQLPGLGLGFNLAVGVLNVVAMLGWTALSGWAAWGAYQGERSPVPFLGPWAEARLTPAPRSPRPSPPEPGPPPAPRSELAVGPEEAWDEQAFRPPTGPS